MVAHPAIDDRDARPLPFRGQNQIRPQLELRQHQQRRPHPPHRGPHGPAEIKRAIEHGEVGVLLARQLEAGPARRRDDNLPIGVRRSQLDDRSGHQIHFADADGVNPNAVALRFPPRHEAQQLLRDIPRDTCRYGTPAKR